jgi:radical SAM superfamily enzyme
MKPQDVELFSQINSILEFGLQTIIPAEEKLINRPNNHEKIKQIIQILNSFGLLYEVSIIYGLPGQTYTSFLKTVEFLEQNNVPIIKMYPLGILRGTPLDLMREVYHIKTTKLSRFDTDIVVSTFSFGYKEWEQMHLFAQNYKNVKLCQKSLL